MTKPTAEEVVEYFSSLSNWGRWGKDDQLGTLNFITPEKVARSAGLIVEGVRVSCSSWLATMGTGPMSWSTCSGRFHEQQRGS